MDLKERKYYELAFLINDPKNLEELKSLLNKFEVEIFNEGEVKKINLAYPVKKQTQAYFGYLNFISEPEKIFDIDKQLKFLNFLLRFMIMKMNKYYLKSILKEEEKMLESENKEKEEKSKDEESKISDFEDSILTNEALEKKIEEILN